MLTDWTAWLFDPRGLTPHGFCLLWQPGLIWTHAVADAAIGLAYYTIPLALIRFARRRRDLVFRPLFWLFAAFILLCGTVHWFELLTLWIPAYGAQGAVKVMTALASVLTAVALWRLLPQALALPSPAQLREALAALRESETRHRVSFEESPVPLFTLDDAGRIIGVSNSWLALLGYRKEEVIGRHSHAFEVDTDDWTATTLLRLQEGGEVRDVERRLRRRDGALVHTHLSARLERRGTARWIVCVVVDITARRQAEAALRESEARLHQAQKMEAVGQLTGGIAHDFNNMLQDIAGCLDLMERRIGQGRTDQVLRYVTPARQSVMRAAGLTQRMLAFARRQALRPAAVDPDTLVRGMEQLIRRTLGPSIDLQVSLHDGVWQALCDANQLESALLNLVINARDAMPQGGRLSIATADRVLERADLAAHEDVAPGCYVEIAVADTGSGMSEDVLARAFEPFFTTKPIGQGTGLGLSQLYGFVRQSGGLVRLDSAPERGTIVRMYLPRHEGTAEAAADTPAAGAGAESPAGGTVLVVEDEPGLRALIGEALEEAGLQMVEAADGPAGLAVLRSQARVDLLITDVGLPGLGGRQLAEAARSLRRGMPIILITGYAGAALDGLEAGADLAILRKPFPLDALTNRARSLLAALAG
jgi:PAS domain S-box-containing protein